MTSRHDDYLYENAFNTALVIIYSDFLKNQVELVSEINQVIQKKNSQNICRHMHTRYDFANI